MASRKRSVRIRERDIELDELLGVRAVRHRPPAVPGTTALTSLYPALSFELEAFARAGWSFVAAEPPGSAQIFVRDGTRLWLADGTLSVKFEADVDQAEIDTALGSEGLSATKRSARNLVHARPLEERTIDAIDAATRLAGRPGVVFAEPVFIQAIGAR